MERGESTRVKIRETSGDILADIRELLSYVLSALGGTEDIVSWDHNHSIVPDLTDPKHLSPLSVLSGSELVIRAMPTNTGNVYLGNSETTVLNINKRVTLQPNEATELKIPNASLVWLDAQVVNEGVEFWSEVKK